MSTKAQDQISTCRELVPVTRQAAQKPSMMLRVVLAMAVSVPGVSAM
ncbi:MAG: hypothetical protein KDI74_14160 [Gammaproteobacteria bacterium]|nr:hypothetical protein [Gammaproteobacteria bacterium]HXK56309.1 hypothetical protein [Gammaproteobacteria bacterium]